MPKSEPLHLRIAGRQLRRRRRALPDVSPDVPYPSLNCPHLNSSSSNPCHAHQQCGVDARSVLLSVGFIYFLTLLAIFAACSITYSVVQGFYGRPVRLLSATKSMGTPFPLSTLIRTQTMTLSIFLLRICWLFVLKGAELVIGHEISYSSPYLLYFLELEALITGTLGLILASRQGQWVLANVISVAQSGHGFSLLQRSAYMVRAMRRVAL